MTDDGGRAPKSPDEDKAPGWYPQEGPNFEAYWDGRTWTALRRWSGAGWAEAPMDPRNPPAFFLDTGDPSEVERE